MLSPLMEYSFTNKIRNVMNYKILQAFPPMIFKLKLMLCVQCCIIIIVMIPSNIAMNKIEISFAFHNGLMYR